MLGVFCGFVLVCWLGWFAGLFDFVDLRLIAGAGLTALLGLFWIECCYRACVFVAPVVYCFGWLFVYLFDCLRLMF